MCEFLEKSAAAGSLMQLAYHTKSSTLEKADPMRFALQQALRINCFSMTLRVTHSWKVLLRASMKDVVTLLDEKARARLARCSY